MTSVKKISKGDIEKSVAWLLEKKQKDVRVVLRKFRNLSLQKQKQLDSKLLYLASILDHAMRADRVLKRVDRVLKSTKRAKGKS
jgi:hypothetical protein